MSCCRTTWTGSEYQYGVAILVIAATQKAKEEVKHSLDIAYGNGGPGDTIDIYYPSQGELQLTLLVVTDLAPTDTPTKCINSTVRLFLDANFSSH